MRLSVVQIFTPPRPAPSGCHRPSRDHLSESIREGLAARPDARLHAGERILPAGDAGAVGAAGATGVAAATTAAAAWRPCCRLPAEPGSEPAAGEPP